MRVRVIRSAVTSVALVAVAVAGCSTSKGTAGQSAGGAVLNVATTAAITTWDPIASFSTEVFYLANVYEPLLWSNPPGDAEPFRPALAERWEASADKKTWTFHLRSGAVFHDGTPVDAAAVKASVLAAKERGGASFIWAPLAAIDTPDAQTAVFRLKYAAPMELIASSMYGAWIVSPKALSAAAADDKYFESGIDAGSGPYTVAEYRSGQRVVLKKFDRYWGGWSGARYATVVNQITPEAVVQQQMLQGNQVNIATSLPLENVDALRKDSGLQVTECATAQSYLGFFNTTRKPLDDVRVRQALSYALPYSDIIAIGAQGFGNQARGPVPNGVFPHSDSTPQYTQDLDRARRLLAEAGHPGGGFDIKITYAAENQSEKRFAPLIKDALAKVGVTAKITPILFNQQWEQAKGNPTEAQDVFLLLYWPTYSDAGSDNLNSLFRSSAKPYFNLSYWKSSAYDTLVDEAMALTATDQAGAAAKYQEAMKVLVDQAPGFFLYDVRAPLVASKAVQGLACNPNYSFNLFFHALSSGVS